MAALFDRKIDGWTSWGRVYTDISAWERLIGHIFNAEGLPLASIEPLIPGTNAVFKVASLVVKIFAPAESGVDPIADFNTELYGIGRANALEIPSPKLAASGLISDSYDFYYLVTEFADAVSFAKSEAYFSDNDKTAFGKNLRGICDRMNTECALFNNINAVDRALSNKRWDIFPDSFNRMRREHLEQLGTKTSAPVFVHGDLNPDNLLISGEKIYVIDFADALRAPADYELAAIVFELFEFGGAYLRGYFGEDFDAVKLADRLFDAVLMHDFGAGMIRSRFGETSDFTDLGVLRSRIYNALLQNNIS